MKRTHRKKELTEVQVLKKENRELKAELTKAHRQLKQLEKQKHNYVEDAYAEPDEDQEIEVKCPECYTGTVKTLDFGIKIMHTCSQCTWRKVVTNG